MNSAICFVLIQIKEHVSPPVALRSDAHGLFSIASHP